MILALLLLVASPSAKPAGTLVLDADDPVVEAEVAGVSLRLRVDLDQRDAVELNPAAAARLPVRWGEGFPAQVGPVELPGRAARTTARIGGRDLALDLSTHDRPCCAGVDGAISQVLLPYAVIRFVRRGVAAGPPRGYPLRRAEADGLTITDGPLAVQLSFARSRTVASKAAGVLLAERYGGRWAGSYEMRPEAFDVPRPVRPFMLGRTATILGLPVTDILVRSDYGGGRAMPDERPRAGDILVSRRAVTREWPLVSLGRDHLGRCAEIVYRADPPRLDLAC